MARSALPVPSASGSDSTICHGRPGQRWSTTPAGTDPVAIDRLAALLARGHALEAMLRRAGDDPSIGPAAKLMRTEVDVDANGLQAAVRGPHAMLLDEETERLLYAPGMRIAGGTSEIQRNLIGERVLGLPRDRSS